MPHAEDYPLINKTLLIDISSKTSVIHKNNTKINIWQIVFAARLQLQLHKFSRVIFLHVPLFRSHKSINYNCINNSLEDFVARLYSYMNNSPANYLRNNFVDYGNVFWPKLRFSTTIPCKRPSFQGILESQSPFSYAGPVPKNHVTCWRGGEPEESKSGPPQRVAEPRRAAAGVSRPLRARNRPKVSRGPKHLKKSPESMDKISKMSFRALLPSFSGNHRPLNVIFFRGAVFHRGGVPENCPLALMGRFPSRGCFLTSTGRFPECLNGPISLLKIPWKAAH